MTGGKNRIKHAYAVEDLILIILDKMERSPKLTLPTEVSHKILKTYKNGMVKIQRGDY